MSCNVAFIGLGVMGYPMAGYISKGGHNVTEQNQKQKNGLKNTKVKWQKHLQKLQKMLIIFLPALVMIMI